MYFLAAGGRGGTRGHCNPLTRVCCDSSPVHGKETARPLAVSFSCVGGDDREPFKLSLCHLSLLPEPSPPGWCLLTLQNLISLGAPPPRGRGLVSTSPSPCLGEVGNGVGSMQDAPGPLLSKCLSSSDGFRCPNWPQSPRGGC